MITAVFYDPDTGDITATTQALEGSLNADPRSWLAVSTFQMDYDRTHKVIDGVLTPVINAVFYDGFTGAILAAVRVTNEADLEAAGRPWLQVAEVRNNWSETHTVVDGVLTPIS